VTRRLATALGVLVLSIGLGGCDARVWFVCSLGFCGEALDVFAPETPRDLRAEARTRQVVLTWSSNRDDADAYRIFRSTTPGQGHAFVEEVTVPRERTQTMSFVDRDRQNGTTYHYRLTARDQHDNESLPSIEVSVTPRVGAAPAAPRDLTATARDDAVDLAWTGSEDATAYRIYRSVGEAPPVPLANSTDSRFSDDDAMPGTTYRYLVTAVNADAQESAFSNAVTARAGGTPPPRFLLAWGSDGSGPGQFQEPTDVAVGPQGDVYVADASLDRVQRFTPAGVLVRTYGADGGRCSGGLVHPTAVAVGATGTVYVTDSGPACVQMFRPDGAPAGAFGSYGTGDGEFENPSDVALDDDGSVYVTDIANDTVQKFTPSGGFVARFTPGDSQDVPFDAPAGIAVDPDGTMSVASYSFGRIFRVDPSGSTTASFGGSGAGPGELSRPQGLAFDGHSRLYVADAGNNRIQAFTPEGLFVTRFGAHGPGNGQFEDPRGVATDCSGHVYVADTGNHRIQKFAGAGAPAPCLGRSQEGVRAFAATVPPVRAAASKPGFSLRFTATESRRGRVTQAAGLTSERGARQRGTFTLSPTGRRAGGGIGLLSRDFRRGSWVALLDVRAAGGPAKVTVRGTMLATSRRRPAERLCLGFRGTLTASATVRLRGTFTTLGGTRGAARMRVAGSYDQQISGQRDWVLRGTSGAGRPTAAKPLPASCRRVAKAFSGR
jgi:sugar lactone lactonase YvrE/chitodextrinase